MCVCVCVVCVWCVYYVCVVCVYSVCVVCVLCVFVWCVCVCSVCVACVYMCGVYTCVCVRVCKTDVWYLSLMWPQHSAQCRIHNNMQLLFVSTTDRHTTCE